MSLIKQAKTENENAPRYNANIIFKGNMKILLVITGLGIGGAERLVTNLADRYASLGHEVVLAYFQGKVDLKPSDERVQLVNLNFTRTIIGVIRGAYNLREIIKDFKPDVINSHMVHPNFVCRLLRLVTPINRLVSSAHSPDEGGGIRIPIYRYTDKLADISTNVSEAAVESMVKLNAVKKGRMVNIYNGVDTKLFFSDNNIRIKTRKTLNIPDHERVILAVGRLWEQKDYPNLFEAISLLNNVNPPLILISGDGPLRSELENYVKKLNISEKVIFLGFRHDISELMNACDIFVLPSAWESFGLVVAEAMSAECVVVATDCGGVKEVLGEEGLLVPPRNPPKLAKALETALAYSLDESKKIGKKKKKRVVDLYSIENTANEYLNIYRA